jgi:hypothetical protein
MTKIRNNTKINTACANVVTPKIGSDKQSNPTGLIHCLEASLIVQLSVLEEGPKAKLNLVR